MQFILKSVKKLVTVTKKSEIKYGDLQFSVASI